MAARSIFISLPATSIMLETPERRICNDGNSSPDRKTPGRCAEADERRRNDFVHRKVCHPHSSDSRLGSHNVSEDKVPFGTRSKLKEKPIMNVNEMRSGCQEPGPAENRWLHAWRKHRQELGVWLFAVMSYPVHEGFRAATVYDHYVDPDIHSSPLFLVRFLRTANRSEPHCLSKGTEHRKDDEEKWNSSQSTRERQESIPAHRNCSGYS